MSNFGKYAIVDNVRYHFEREPGTWWEFKPPTAREEISINRFTQGDSVKQSVSGIERKIVTNAEIAREELALTYADSNLVDGKGKPLIDKTMNVDAIKNVIDTFPREMFWELWRALGKTCPGWGALPQRDLDAKVDPDAPANLEESVDLDEEKEVGPKAEASSKR